MNYTKIATDGYADISVIIPVYNCEHYLRNAVQSVLDQPLSTISVILVDDGSTDASSRICDELAQNNTRVSVIHTPNQGVSCARNTGLNAVLKDCSDDPDGYIAFLDADDMWAKAFFDSQVMVQMQSKMDLLCFRSRRCSCDMRFIHDEPDIKERVITGGRNAVWEFTDHFGAVLYSKRLLKKYRVLFDPTLKYSEDKIFLMKCIYLADTIRLSNKVLHLYRQNPVSAIHNRKRGIQHYLPIINGWIASDAEMLQWKDEKGGELRAGRTLAQIYFVDMAVEHYQNWGTRTELEQIVSAHPFYQEFLKTSSKDISPQQYKAFLLYTQHPAIFQLFCYGTGVVYACAKYLLKISWINSRRYRHRFPSTNPYL